MLLFPSFRHFKSNFSIRIEISKEGEEYVAFSPELNVSSFGETIEEAYGIYEVEKR